MVLAAITFGGVLYAMLLTVALILSIAAFIHWISYGGLFGWWMANDMLELIGMIVKGLATLISSMLSD